MAEEKREGKTLEITNTGRGLHVVHDINNNPVQIQPGMTVKVELPAKTAKKIEDRSEVDTIKVGADANAAKNQARDRAEFEAHQAKERAEFEEHERQREAKQRSAMLQRRSDRSMADADKPVANAADNERSERTAKK